MMETGHRLTALDSLRGIAALCVAIGFHDSHFYFDPNNFITKSPLMWRVSGIFANGWLFVDLFFVISGFVFSYVYRSRILAGLSTGSFAWGRITRLYPLHLLTLAVLVGIGLVRYRYGWGNFIFASEFARLPRAAILLGFGLLDEDMRFNGPTWSLSCELVCYAIFYAVIRLADAWRRPIWLALVALGALGVMLRAESLPVVNLGLGRALLGYFAGCLMYEAMEARTLAGRAGRLVWIGAGVAVAGWLLVQGRLPYGLYLYSLLLFPALVAVASAWRPLARVLAISPLRQIGAMSYSIYLVHYPIQAAFVTAAALAGWRYDPDTAWFVLIYAAAVLAVAALSWRYVEQPAMRLLRRRAPRSAPFLRPA